MTGLDLISGSLKLLGVLAAGETANGNDAQDALSRLNDLVDAWNLERLFIFTVVRTPKTLGAGTASYTIGTGGSINIVRPLWIDHASLIIDTSASTPTEVGIEVFTDQRWQGIAQKTLQSGLSQGIFYDYAWTAGLGQIYPWPIPNVGTTQLVLYAPGTAVSAFADLVTDYTFPPGYKRMLRYNLAVELAPEFGRALDPVVSTIAERTIGNVKRANSRPRELKCDPAVTGHRGVFDYRTGGYR